MKLQKQIIIAFGFISFAIIAIYTIWVITNVNKGVKVENGEISYDIDFSKSFDKNIFIRFDKSNTAKFLTNSLGIESNNIRYRMDQDKITIYATGFLGIWNSYTFKQVGNEFNLVGISSSFLPLPINLMGVNKNYREKIFGNSTIFKEGNITKIFLNSNGLEITLFCEDIENIINTQ